MPCSPPADTPGRLCALRIGRGTCAPWIARALISTLSRLRLFWLSAWLGLLLKPPIHVARKKSLRKHEPWAGHRVVVRSVIFELRATFGNRRVTRVEIERFFGGFNEGDFGRLHTNFVGWIVDETPHCFLWNCLYRKEHFYRDFYFEGTGENYFETIRRDQQSWHSGGSGLPPDASTVVSAINAVARARFEESLYRETWDISFGASYDILVLLDGQFRYVGSVVYLGWDYHWNSSLNTGRLENAPVVIKHSCLGECSILQESLQGKHYTG